MPLLPVLPQHDIHEKIVEEAIEAVLSTVDLQAVLERTGRLLNDRFGTTRVAIHPVRPRFREERWLSELGYGSVVSFPLLFEDEALGVLNIAHPPREGLL